MSDTSRLAVVAGSFDPLTNGHLDLIERGVKLFDRLVVAVLVNPSKQPLFTIEERTAMIRAEVEARGWRVDVDTFTGLLADYVRAKKAAAIVRGLRTAGEFSDEWPTALMNRHLEPGCETVFVVPAAGMAHISSRLVREIASLGGPIEGLVPERVASNLRRRFAPR
jgi:pantetheine-phosphate adenylyltransferase